MAHTRWRLSELAARLQINEDFEFLGEGVCTPSAQSSPMALQQAWAGSILMRKRWQSKPNVSGLALIAPASSAARADGLLAMRDDSEPINLSIIANDTTAAQDRPPVTLIKWATLLRDFVVLVPNALSHGDPASSTFSVRELSKADTGGRRTSNSSVSSNLELAAVACARHAGGGMGRRRRSHRRRPRRRLLRSRRRHSMLVCYRPLAVEKSAAQLIRFRSHKQDADTRPSSYMA